MRRLVFAFTLLFSVEALADSASRLAGLFPKKAGRLELMSPAGTDKWPKEEDRHASGDYSWGPKPGNVPLAAPLRSTAAELKCEAKLLLSGADAFSGCLGGKTVRLGSHKGCMEAEDKPGTPGAMGLFISWPGCGLQFKVGAMSGQKLSDAMAAAAEMADWSSGLKR